ncbi:MAG TPA: NAD(P)H-binding protein [Pseudonocardiaceae bacterium]|nr:NAD(P)H-binding protein [Pseudonocardiaceae bacterium]
MPAERIGVSVRDTGKAADLAALGLRVRVGDFQRPETLAAAFEGAEQVLIVSGPADPAPHRAAIDAAVAAGAKRVLYTSHMGASPDSEFIATRSHARTELDLQAAGVPFTVLRNGFYATTTAWTLRPALDTGELILPEDGPVSWTAHVDLVDAAVLALTEPERLSGVTPALTGPESLDYQDIAAIASELTGRTITRITVPDEEWRQAMRTGGMPEGAVELTLGIFRASRRREFAAVDPAMERLLGRQPVTAREVLAASLTG